VTLKKLDFFILRHKVPFPITAHN